MKAISCFLLTLVTWSATVSTAWTAATPGTAILEFTTRTEGWAHSPHHVLAVWITDAKTNYVTTLLQHGDLRAKHLMTWNSMRRGKPAFDATTGATLTSHKEVVAIWNGRNQKSVIVPDGTYLFFAEFTEGNFQGPIAVFPFIKGPQVQSKVFTNQPNFKDIKASFKPESE
jgi:hypothetical protein